MNSLTRVRGVPLLFGNRVFFTVSHRLKRVIRWLAQLAEIPYQGESTQDKWNYVNHLLISPDSERFNPYREMSARRVQPFGLTFGLGVHNCLGRDLDAGLVPQSDTQPDDHQFGTVTALVRVVLCDLGAISEPDDPPQRDNDSVRGNWQRFPLRVRFPQS